jgi:glycosyltransferase involved in cell wall biosynthesis
LAGGGAERIMARLLSQSDIANNEIHLALLDEEPSAYQIPAGIKIHRLDTKGSLIRGFLPLLGLTGLLNPEICVSFLTRSNLLAIVVCKLRGIRCVISERVNTSSHHPTTLAGRVARLSTRIAYPQADRVIAVSAGIADDLSSNYGVRSDRIDVIANPIDSNYVRAQANDTDNTDVARPLVAAMGRLVPNKNFGMLIDAFARWHDHGTLMIIGEGPLRAELEAHAQSLGIAERVIFTGFIENPFKNIATADCYVLSSNGEGFPNGLIEAMILGTPVVSTNCHSGPAEILDDRPYFSVSGPTECKFGLLVPTNDPDSLAKALALACEPGQRQPRSNRAIAGTQRYGMEATIARYWESITGAARSSP